MYRLEKHKQSLDYCTYCPKLCTFACPVSNAEKSETVTPWAKMTLANLIRKGYLELNAETAEPLYHCMSCRLCTSYCKHEIDVAEVLTGARTMLAEKGIVHPALNSVRENINKHQNAYGENLSGKLKKLLGKKYFTKDSQAIYFPGPEAIIGVPEEITATFSIFEKLGIDFVSCYSGQDFCSGLPLYRAGFKAEFEKYATRLGKQLLDYKLIITPCAETAYALKALYMEQGINLSSRVRHILEFLDPYLQTCTFKHGSSSAVAFHDPSYLSRYISDEKRAREILHLFYNDEIVDLIWDEKSAYSSGHAGIYHLMYPEMAAKIAKERVRQASELRVETLLTSSTGTAFELKKVCKEFGVKVRTLTCEIDENLISV